MRSYRTIFLLTIVIIFAVVAYLPSNKTSAHNNTKKIFQGTNQSELRVAQNLSYQYLCWL